VSETQEVPASLESPPLLRHPELNPEDELFKTIIEQFLERIEKMKNIPTKEDLNVALEIAEAEVLRQKRDNQENETAGKPNSLSQELKNLYLDQVPDDLKAHADSMLTIIGLCEQMYAELEKYKVDSLTNVFSRKKYVEDIQRLVENRRKNRPSFALLAVDVDKLKSVNDKYGHLAGDKLLIAVVTAFREVLREGDKLYRLGGDEFVIVAEGDLAGAKKLAERLIKRLSSTSVMLGETEETYQPSCSIGIAHSDQLRADLTPESLFALADQALYKAKNSRRGSVAVALG
jgi:diguanylate cyclase (GGDEF)-like protein